MWLRQSTAVVVSFGPFLDKTDGVTPETGLVTSLDHASTGIFLSKNGGTLTIRHAAVTASTYDSYGNYKVTLDTTDTNTLGTLRMQFIETATCLPVWQDFMILPSQVWDSFFGADALQVHAVEISNALITAASIAADAITAAKVASDVTDEIWAKACTEPSAVVAASPTAIAAVSWLLSLSRNKITQTSTTQILKADDGSTTVATSTISDDSTTFTRGKFV